MDDPPRVSNEQIASILERVAEQLQAQNANVYRVDAYRAGANVVRRYEGSVQELALREGRESLDALPRIGKSLAAAIDEVAHSGRLRMLDRLEGQLSPVALFQSIPGLGEELAERIHHELQIDTLEALEAAAHDGRLDAIAGFGPGRLETVRAVLARRLDRSSRRNARRFDALPNPVASALETGWERPPVELLLGVDRLYRAQAEQDALPKIAPKRNNPKGERWLPVLHLERDGWEFTAMFSNTERAHALGRTGDWVVLYFDRDGHEDQCTVVTEFRGPMSGKRVVRGREDETAEHYRSSTS